MFWATAMCQALKTIISSNVMTSPWDWNFYLNFTDMKFEGYYGWLYFPSVIDRLHYGPQ